MILSSADIARILGGDAIIRQEAIVSIVDGRVSLGTEDKVYIYIDKYPTVDEFEAVWKLRVVDSASDLGDLVRKAIESVLPGLESKGSDYLVRDFRTSETETRPEGSKALQLAEEAASGLRQSFSRLEQDIQDRMLLVNSGKPGRDGRDGIDGAPGRNGRDGADGRDGRDIDATETELFDLKDVDPSPIPLGKGQVLTWDGEKWTNLYVRQTTTYIGGGSGSGSGAGGNGQINSDTITSDTAPTEREDGKGPLLDGDTWWRSNTGQLFVYYVDGDAGQWVEIDTGEGGGSGARVLDDLNDVTTDGVQDGYILVYNSSAGQWEARENDGSSGGGSTGGGCSGIVDGGNADDGTAIAPECAPVDSVNGQTGTVVLDADDIDDSTTLHKFASQSQLDAADSALQPGDNVSELVNDAGYITLTEVPESGIPEAPQDGGYYVRHNGAWIDLAAALYALNDSVTDGGNFTTGTSAGDNTVTDGGVFS